MKKPYSANQILASNKFALREISNCAVQASKLDGMCYTNLSRYSSAQADVRFAFLVRICNPNKLALREIFQLRCSSKQIGLDVLYKPIAMHRKFQSRAVREFAHRFVHAEEDAPKQIDVPIRAPRRTKICKI